MARRPRPVSAAPGAFLSADQVAFRLGVSVRSIRRLIDSGELRIHRIGGSVRVAPEDLAVYLARHGG